ncbi:hypothetical protein ACFR9U_08120 [Halorientalis brevis]|uniref:DUF7311 domain-containing protein n=1 Tax=Halorientalis brevis TaxID=1126241 RepID=A0ABD6C9C0_9EURY|nr:hypothetical protein [Halorientalis brevis]
MLRVVVAVTLSVALLTVTLPALETARRDRSDRRVTAELDRLAAAIQDVYAREAAVSPDATGAQRIVAVRIPTRSWTGAAVEYVAIGAHPERAEVDERNETTFGWQVSGARSRTRRLADVPVEAATPGDGDSPLVIREPGRHRLALSLVVRDGQRTVVVRRVD